MLENVGTAFRKLLLIIVVILAAALFISVLYLLLPRCRLFTAFYRFPTAFAREFLSTGDSLASLVPRGIQPFLLSRKSGITSFFLSRPCGTLVVQLWYTSGTLSPGIRCLVPGRGRVGLTGWSGTVHLLVTCWLGRGLLAG